MAIHPCCPSLVPVPEDKMADRIKASMKVARHRQRSIGSILDPDHLQVLLRGRWRAFGRERCGRWTGADDGGEVCRMRKVSATSRHLSRDSVDAMGTLCVCNLN